MTKQAPKRQRRKPGNILAIPMPDNSFCFGRELRKGVVAFYDLRSTTLPEISDIVMAAVLFKVPVMDYAIKSGRWRIVGNLPLDPDLAKPVDFFMQDVFTGKFSIYHEGGHIVPASPEEIIGLEREAGWDPEHVEDRLRDHYAGVPNIWYESMKPKLH